MFFEEFIEIMDEREYFYYKGKKKGRKRGGEGNFFQILCYYLRVRDLLEVQNISGYGEDVYEIRLGENLLGLIGKESGGEVEGRVEKRQEVVCVFLEQIVVNILRQDIG